MQLKPILNEKDCPGINSISNKNFYALENYKIAVLIPCYNEEVTIGKVVEDFHKSIPSAEIYVYNNNSTDMTSEIAFSAGAIVRNEILQGKGNVVRRMFRDIDADFYVLVDGDDTYHADSAPDLLNCLIINQLDMVNAARVERNKLAYRKGHRFGNLILTGIVGLFFGDQFNDILSGFRVFSRRYVKSFPVLSREFEIETEITIHALEMGMPVAEIETPYKERPLGSTSKLNTYRDGYRILKTIANMVKNERPLAFFFMLFILLALTSVLLSIPIIIEYNSTGLVPRFPTAILVTGMMLLAFLFLACGLILDIITHTRREMKRLCYLTLKHPVMQKQQEKSKNSQ